MTRVSVVPLTAHTPAATLVKATVNSELAAPLSVDVPPKYYLQGFTKSSVLLPFAAY